MADPDTLPVLAPDSIAAIVRREGTIAWEQTSAELASSLRARLTLAFLGSASSGKDSAIRAIFGVDFGEISPIPGSTTILGAPLLLICLQLVIRRDQLWMPKWALGSSLPRENYRATIGKVRKLLL